MSLRLHQIFKEENRHFKSISTLNNREQRHHDFEKHDSCLEPFLILAILISSQLFSDPVEQLCMNLDNILAVQASDDRELAPTNYERARKKLGQKDGIGFVVYHAVQHKGIRLKMYVVNKYTNSAEWLDGPLVLPG